MVWFFVVGFVSSVSSRAGEKFLAATGCARKSRLLCNGNVILLGSGAPGGQERGVLRGPPAPPHQPRGPCFLRPHARLTWPPVPVWRVCIAPLRNWGTAGLLCARAVRAAGVNADRSVSGQEAVCAVWVADPQTPTTSLGPTVENLIGSHS